MVLISRKDTGFLLIVPVLLKWSLFAAQVKALAVFQAFVYTAV